MKIHHLNCGSFCPLSHPFLNRAMPLLDQFNLVCHCLLIESEAGLILVDTGLGLDDVKNHKRFKSNFIFNQFAKPKLDVDETAFVQITKLGFNPKDVRHIIASHFDADHIGGLPDFPNATIHLMKDEWDRAQNPKSARDKSRYQRVRWEQNQNFKTYSPEGDSWHGFKRVQNLEGIDNSIYLVSLPGHTKGHAGVLIESETPILFVGDAFLLENQLKSEKELLPLTLYNKLVHEDLAEAKKTLEGLRRLKEESPDLDIFCSHDQTQFLKFRQGVK
jgi:glyoxylase-like metal-dependent hydrolase (beta-lactamase superfamily II)